MAPRAAASWWRWRRSIDCRYISSVSARASTISRRSPRGISPRRLQGPKADMDKKQPHPLFKLATELGPLIVFFIANAKFHLFVATGAFMVAVVAAMLASYAHLLADDPVNPAGGFRHAITVLAQSLSCQQPQVVSRSSQSPDCSPSGTRSSRRGYNLV